MLDLVFLIAPYCIAKVYVQNKFLKLFIYISVFARQSIAFVNSLPDVQLYGSGADAERFLSYAIDTVWHPSREFPLWLTDGYSIYIFGLRFVNKSSELLIQLFNPEFTFQILNIFVFILSIVLIESRFESKRYDWVAKIVLISLLFYPFSLTYNTYVLRESFQLLLISLTIRLFDIPFKLTLKRLLAFFIILVSAPIFHFTYIIPILFSILCFIFLSEFRLLKISKSLLVGFIFTFIMLLLSFHLRIGLTSGNGLTDSDPFSSQELYLDGAIRTNEEDQTRTFYISSSQDFLLLPLFYRSRPFLHEVRTFFDLSLFLGNLFVSLVYIKLIIVFFRQKESLSSQQELIVIAILALIPNDIFWSIGTVNWGTSSRHSTAVTLVVLMLFAHYRALRKSGST